MRAHIDEIHTRRVICLHILCTCLSYYVRIYTRLSTCMLSYSHTFMHVNTQGYARIYRYKYILWTYTLHSRYGWRQICGRGRKRKRVRWGEGEGGNEGDEEFGEWRMILREERQREGNGRLNTGTFLYIIFGSNQNVYSRYSLVYTHDIYQCARSHLNALNFIPTNLSFVPTNLSAPK